MTNQLNISAKNKENNSLDWALKAVPARDFAILNTCNKKIRWIFIYSIYLFAVTLLTSPFVSCASRQKKNSYAVWVFVY